MNKEVKPPENNPNLEQILKEKELQRQKIILINKRDSAPVLNDLSKLGYSLQWISDLYSQKLYYENAIPILIKWLPLVDNIDVKEDIVRALTVKWAKPEAAHILIKEYRKLYNESNTGIKWAIANAFTVVADDSIYDDLVEIINDKSNGESRKMLALTLGRMKNPKAEDILITLLNDEVVAGHAVMGLGKLKSKKAIPVIKTFLSHPRTWIRNEAKKALLRIEKSRN
jgi:HEAT repeat protein